MTDKAEEYRVRAEQCRRKAEQVFSPLDRDFWLQLAAEWMTMASIHEQYSLGQHETRTRR